MAGNALSGNQATFTTGDGIDLILPAVVTLQVNERFSPLRFSPDARVLTENNTGQQVPGTVSLSADLTTVSLVPDAPLVPRTLYRIIPNFGAADLAGNNLSGTQTAFTTAP